jgi:hypothetical protein
MWLVWREIAVYIVSLGATRLYIDNAYCGQSEREKLTLQRMESRLWRFIFIIQRNENYCHTVPIEP